MKTFATFARQTFGAQYRDCARDLRRIDREVDHAILAGKLLYLDVRFAQDGDDFVGFALTDVRQQFYRAGASA